MLISGLVEGASVGVWGMKSEEDTLAFRENNLHSSVSNGNPLLLSNFKGFEWVLIRVRKAKYLPIEIVVSAKQPSVEVLSVIDPMFRFPDSWWKRLVCRHDWGEWSDPETYQWTGWFSILSQADFSWRTCQKCGNVGQRMSQSVRRVDG